MSEGLNDTHLAKTLTMTNIFSYNDIWTALSNNVTRKVFCDLLREKEDLQRHIKALEAENKRLQEALKEIAEFANNEYWKRIPAPSCVKFMTIKRYAEKALKGAGE